MLSVTVGVVTGVETPLGETSKKETCFVPVTVNEILTMVGVVTSESTVRVIVVSLNDGICVEKTESEPTKALVTSG